MHTLFLQSHTSTTSQLQTTYATQTSYKSLQLVRYATLQKQHSIMCQSIINITNALLHTSLAAMYTLIVYSIRNEPIIGNLSINADDRQFSDKLVTYQLIWFITYRLV